MAEIALGTSSWSFDGWRGVFYPEKLPASRFLEFYAGRFRSVETNTSFYAVPKPATLINWVDTVPTGFTFSLKFPRLISHERRLVDCRKESIAFMEVLHSLGPAAAPAFLQLSPTFTRRNGGSDLAHYLTWLATRLDGLRIAVEVRARDLFTEAFATFLAELGLSPVLVDRAGTPDLFDIWAQLVDDGKAPDWVMIRWIGDDRDGPKGDREVTAPRDADLARWAGRIALLHRQGVDVFGYMHNPYEGHAPASVRRLEERLKGLVALPRWAPPVRAPSAEGQLSLFDQ